MIFYSSCNIFHRRFVYANIERQNQKRLAIETYVQTTHKGGSPICRFTHLSNSKKIIAMSFIINISEDNQHLNMKSP